MLPLGPRRDDHNPLWLAAMKEIAMADNHLEWRRLRRAEKASTSAGSGDGGGVNLGGGVRATGRTRADLERRGIL